MIKPCAWLAVVVFTLAACAAVKTPETVVQVAPAVVQAPQPTADKPGAACLTEGTQRCVDQTTSIVCVDNEWEALSCRGAKGCDATGKNVDCDNDGYNEGEYCDLSVDKFECSADKTYEVKCIGKRWTMSDKCLGSRACTSTETEVKCDTSVSDFNAPCLHDGSYSCAPDRKQILTCVDHKLIFDQYCRGAHGCKQTSDNKLNCDDSIALPGDPCDADEERDKIKACSVDHTQLLLCKGGKMTAFKKCKAGCVVPGPEPECK